MSSTNHTTNYNLPQFVGSDKPAWLGDINPAMAAIDTAIKTADTTAQQGVADAATAQTAANTADTKATAAQTAAETAQNTANTAIANTSSNAGRITTLEQAFNFTNIRHIAELPAGGTGGWARGCDLTLAQNADGSVFKFYGLYIPTNNTASAVSVSKPQVAGLTGVYGIATGLYLTDAPDEAYQVTCAGLYYTAATGSYIWNSSMWQTGIAVGTDGQIYISVNNSQNESIPGNQLRFHEFYPCVYFNTNFGDKPTSGE